MTRDEQSFFVHVVHTCTRKVSALGDILCCVVFLSNKPELEILVWSSCFWLLCVIFPFSLISLILLVYHIELLCLPPLLLVRRPVLNHGTSIIPDNSISIEKDKAMNITEKYMYMGCAQSTFVWKGIFMYICVQIFKPKICPDIVLHISATTA